MKNIELKNELIAAIEKANRTHVAVYHGRHYGQYGSSNRSKSWATKLVDRLFQTLSVSELASLTIDEKSFCRKYLADGWYYAKYNAKKQALGIGG